MIVEKKYHEPNGKWRPSLTGVLIALIALAIISLATWVALTGGK